MNCITFRTYINRPSTSWIDDYFDWADLSSCCKYYSTNNSFCPHSISDTYCKSCTIVKNNWNRPDVQSFSKFLSYFLQDNPDDKCSKAGHAAYSDVKLINNLNSSFFLILKYFLNLLFSFRLLF